MCSADDGGRWWTYIEPRSAGGSTRQVPSLRSGPDSLTTLRLGRLTRSACTERSWPSRSGRGRSRTFKTAGFKPARSTSCLTRPKAWYPRSGSRRALPFRKRPCVCYTTGVWLRDWDSNPDDLINNQACYRLTSSRKEFWSWRRDLHPQSPAYDAGAFLLSHASESWRPRSDSHRH